MAQNSSVLEESKRRFQQILEYVNYAGRYTITDEAEEPQNTPMPQDDPNAMPPQDGPMPPMDGGMGGAPQDGGAIPQGDPNAMPPQDGQMPADGGMGSAPQGNGPEGFAPQDDPNAMPPMDDSNAMPPMDGGMNPDDQMVDITDLTDAQEETEEKLDNAEEKFDEKFQKVFSAIKNIENLISSNDEKINSLKDEFEKRNPTDIEKLEMQSVKSGPFTVKPDEYWKEKENSSNYRIGNDDEKAKYEIRANDIGGVSDWKNISDTLDDNILYHQTMKNTMGI